MKIDRTAEHHEGNVLVTGASGNIGRELIKYLSMCYPNGSIIAAVRDLEGNCLGSIAKQVGACRVFDFEDSSTFQQAFTGIEILFLLRPPHISDVKKVFIPMLDAAWNNGIRKVVFLSVQGVESSSIIPHHKIEAYIISKGFDHIFVRPSYFMQNLTTTLRSEILRDQRITLPSGHALFNWVDAENVGEATAVLIKQFDDHRNEAFDITGTENLSFYHVTERMSRILDKPISFQSINPIRFFWRKRQEGIGSGLALVMTLLHYLPRIQDQPIISRNYEALTGTKPKTIDQFIAENSAYFKGNPS